MLELKNITKEYPAGNGKVEALKGVSLCFRKSEFVSILGPSGCGKTTALNIIGGLDHYTTGDLIINGRSTKDFQDRDWDAYRNHSVGFVFQSYNLIPHQSVLQNVELALSLSGVTKSGRRRRAKEALERVGLGDQLKKRPGEMSGGQMQRVAIARAIVNDPDIILADEPTGALDTETSVQVMEILKEISRDRLVIMVTHNPDLADTYSTRIIRMLDGVIRDDSAPVSQQEREAMIVQAAEREAGKKKQKLPSMSFVTSFGLSLRNLFTKKGRTALTSFAGSIGIIGIALIYAVSQGMTSYIDLVQEETLSSYPLTLETTHMDMSSLLESFLGQAQSTGEHEDDGVYQKALVYNMMNALSSMKETKNDLRAFKEFIEQERANPKLLFGFAQAVSGVQYRYGLDLLVYTKGPDGKILQSDTEALTMEIMGKYLGMTMSNMSQTGAASGLSGMTSMAGQNSLWQELLPGDNGAAISPIVEKQYDLIYGAWPNRYDQIVLVVDENNELDDMTLYALGLKTREDIDKIVEAALNRKPLEFTDQRWTYEEICGMDFRVVLNGDCYKRDAVNGAFIDLRETEAGLTYLYDNGIVLQVTGIIRPKEDALSPMLTGSIGYTSMLTEYVIQRSGQSEAVNAQLASPDRDIFTGLPFRSTGDSMTVADKAEAFRTYVAGLNQQEKAAVFIRIAGTPTREQLDAAVDQILSSMTRQEIEEQLVTVLTQQMSIDPEEVRTYLEAMGDQELRQLIAKAVEEQYTEQYAAQVEKQLSALGPDQLVAMLEESMETYTEEQLAQYYDTVPEFSDSDYETNLRILGSVDLDTPVAINLYASTFDDKEIIEKTIRYYNENVEEFEKIAYTDYVGLMMDSVTTIINAITYVLIAFVAVSLVVSSIMIGVITLISVQERTKEIGILRAIGASKRNVSGMFNAETMIIGLTSGLLGVGITYLLCIPINLILHALTGIGNLNARLPVQVALLLVLISVLLTLISGIIPSRSAAKKDPVVALRTE